LFVALIVPLPSLHFGTLGWDAAWDMTGGTATSCCTLQRLKMSQVVRVLLPLLVNWLGSCHFCYIAFSSSSLLVDHSRNPPLTKVVSFSFSSHSRLTVDGFILDHATFSSLG